jgi:hypothetical protein
LEKCHPCYRNQIGDAASDTLGPGFGRLLCGQLVIHKEHQVTTRGNTRAPAIEKTGEKRLLNDLSAAGTLCAVHVLTHKKI